MYLAGKGEFAALFFTVEKTFAGPCMEGRTEVYCNLLPFVWISFFFSLQMNIYIPQSPPFLERKAHKIILNHVLLLSWQNAEKCRKFKLYGIHTHNLFKIKCKDQNLWSFTKESPKRSFIFLIPFPCLHLFYTTKMYLFGFSFCSMQHFCLRKILLSHYQPQPNRLFKNGGENKGCGFQINSMLFNPSATSDF